MHMQTKHEQPMHGRPEHCALVFSVTIFLRKKYQNARIVLLSVKAGYNRRHSSGPKLEEPAGLEPLHKLRFRVATLWPPWCLKSCCQLSEIAENTPFGNVKTVCKRSKRHNRLSYPTPQLKLGKSHVQIVPTANCAWSAQSARSAAAARQLGVSRISRPVSPPAFA